MTRDVIADASISAKWFVSEERSDVARQILGSGAPLHAPDFMVLEFAAVMWKKVRRGTIS